ncbi:MAG: peptidoglycan-binding protein LysM [Flavobacteriaceae bacterium]|nr:MAG: peptidoglycan-binding protein LysM [Flavobacteriaceae bacterium]
MGIIMKKTSLKSVLLITMLLLFSFKALAQQFVTHAVKDGETIESIAKQYKVTPYNILSYNKEIKHGDVLRANTILVIPLAANTSNPVISSNTNEVTSEKEEPIVQQEPIGFLKHKVRKRETLYGISQRYHITQEDIKRYNRDLYSVQLKKGMRLKIPKYLRIDPNDENALNEDDYETYAVQPKETRWSIAYRYGITIDSLLVLNPQLPKNDDSLAEGQELKLPKPKGSSLEEQEVQLYFSYTVPKAIGFFRLKEEFGVSAEELMKLNPEIVERGGLKEGMVLRIPQKKVVAHEVNTDNYIFYVVKPKQTEYSLTRNMGVTYRELLDLNPDLINGLKAGMVLKLPKDKMGDLEVKNSLILDKISLLDSINTMNKPKLLVMLPFLLDRIDINDTEEIKKIIQKRNDIKYALGLYSGTLIALDSIKKLGISVDVKTYDTGRSQIKVKEILLRENLMNVSAILGPLDPKLLKEVAVQASNYEVPVIAPSASSSDLSLDNVFFSMPSDSILRDKMLSFVERTFTGENIIVIADESGKKAKEKIMERFPATQVLALKNNISLDIENFRTKLSEEKENWVFLETDNFKVVSSVSSILNSAKSDTTLVRMFTTNKNKGFEHDVISSSHLSKLNFTYPSYNKDISNNSFMKMYEKRFGTKPDRYAIRGFDIAYDLLLKLAYKNDLFEVSKLIGETEYTGSKFNYGRDMISGYSNSASYILKYEEMRVIEVTPEKLE